MGETLEVTGHQLAAARALAGLDPTKLAQAAKIRVSALSRLEAEAGALTESTEVASLRAALESAGVEFLADEDGGRGVRLRKPRLEPDSIDTSELNASNDE